MVKAEEMVNNNTGLQQMATMAILVKDRIHLTSWVKISFLAFKVSRFNFLSLYIEGNLFFFINIILFI